MQRQAHCSPDPSGESYHFFHYLLMCGRGKAGPVFCEELSTLQPPGRLADSYNRAVTAVEASNTSPWLQRIALRLLLAALVLLAIAYAADYCAFRYRLAAQRQPFGSVTVEHYYEVAHKNGKAEIIFDPPAQKTCVHSLFPHSGAPPCWFLTRHAERKTDL